MGTWKQENGRVFQDRTRPVNRGAALFPDDARTYRPLRVEEPPNAVPQLVEEHGVEGGAELQAQQVLHVGADVEADPVVAAHQQGEQPVQEAADGGLVGGGRGEGGRGHQRVGHVAGAHGDHGLLAFC